VNDDVSALAINLRNCHGVHEFMQNEQAMTTNGTHNPAITQKRPCMKRIFPGTHIRLIPIRTSKTTSVVMAASLREHIWI